ncbi:hypothetical protein QO002_000593 [Pararhizobium capsulatum DSM 1112]|uniref:Uncharacterized protein n=1 Tax=Pararhizobium capsulatum DSM 1112 TaxID=1121113 RepID=A0ABU0BLW7_9HYPH|nr:hypothetical protein [Pararhizobium capsulatum]MDQ0318455.1 hypothetical protein [Pararhizobium capsulatum DSM 1112]
MKKLLVVAAFLCSPALLAALSPPVLAATAPSELGDLSEFKVIATDRLALVTKGDLTAAKKRITDFETTWDQNEATLYQKNHDEWGVIDDAADLAIGALRKGSPDPVEAEQAVSGLINALEDPMVH